ncbi:MAG TPA: pseudouridine synthase [Burkholderiaceae bacterium]|nr:pseudouridine synthase [Burkholderiaceae bacterium]
MNPTDRDPNAPPAPEQPAAAADAPSQGADAAPRGEASAGPEGGDEAQRRRNRNRRRGRRNRGADRPEGGQGGGPALEVTLRWDEADDDEDESAEGAAPTAAAPADAAPAWTPVEASDRFSDVVSGAYDNEPAPEPEGEAAKRVLAATPDAPKLHKVLAQAGIGSRRDMEQMIADGQITVNGQAAHVGQRITAHDQIRVAGKPVRVRITPPPARVLAYHKPAGEIVTHGDPQNRPTVFRKLPRLQQGKWQSVGRLDINTEGLLLFTNSGDLANRLMHPRFGVEREYAVRVLGTLTEDQREELLEGVDIDGQRATMRSVEDGGGEGANHWYRVVITEGRNREVRRMFESLGLAVSRLIRIRYGCVVLPRGLRRGVWVDLPASDLQTLHNLVGGAPSPHGNQGNGARPNNRNSKNNRGRGPRESGPREGGPREGPPREGGRQQEPRRHDDDNDQPDFASIPNPLQQTFDRRAIREARQPRREISEDGPIPNPLEQTYDKRGVQNPKGIGGGAGNRRGKGGGGGGGGERQPDPMQTSVGYIGADAFHKQMSGGGGGGGGRGRRKR